MAATQTLHQVPSSDNLTSLDSSIITPRHGTVTLYGYGIAISVNRGHLTLRDGIGANRASGRFSRVRHGLRRLIVIGADGMVSLSAIRWLADQDAALVMLERDGSVLVTTGPVRPSDVRLRRAQALAHQSGMAVEIARELIFRKLTGQEKVAREKIRAPIVADSIARVCTALAEANSIEKIRHIEAQGAQLYWSAWKAIPIQFPQKDIDRIPEHWRGFGTRKSPITGSARLAVNPVNAMLNYLYTLLESESCLALAALGMDPGMGVLHVDSPVRNSFACDLMEAIRPQVDGYVLDWISREAFHREWFFEQRDGNCRLMGPFAVRLSETASTWARCVAPVAEWVSRMLWSTLKKPAQQVYPATRLTQNRRRHTQEGQSKEIATAPRPPRICRACGEPLNRGQKHCLKCAAEMSGERMLEVSRLGRAATHSPKAEARRAASMRQQEAAKRAWKSTDLEGWLNEKTFTDRIQPRLHSFMAASIATALGVSKPYATDIRRGKRLPHPRHWKTLADLVGVWSAAV